MSKHTYSVVIIRKGQEKDFYDFWERGLKVNATGERLSTDFLSFDEVVEAKSLADAISIVQNKYPHLIIAKTHSSKIG